MWIRLYVRISAMISAENAEFPLFSAIFAKKLKKIAIFVQAQILCNVR